MVPCNGNGVYNHGVCECFLGWKGAECTVPSDQCISHDCSGNGVCNSNGDCDCYAGFKGISCETSLNKY